MANDEKITIDNYIEASQQIIPINIKVQNNGASDYTITSQSLSGNDPTLTLERGKTYEFDIETSNHPFEIRQNGSQDPYSMGIINNGIANGKLTFTVPNDAPSLLYYICKFHSGMTGTINIVDVISLDLSSTK